jgi:hypothetical protein
MAVLEVACPGCKAGLKAPESMIGKKARCKKCGTAFTIPGGNGEAAGDSQMLSAIEVPAAPVAKTAPKPAPAGGSPFDFGGEPEEAPAPPPPPPPKKPAPAPAAKAKPAPPPPPPVEEEEVVAAEVVAEPAGDPFAFDAPAAAVADDPFAFSGDEPAATPPPPKAKTKAKPAPIPEPEPEPEPAAAAGDDLFAFGGDGPADAPPPPPKAKGKAKPAPKPAPFEEDEEPAAPASYNPFDNYDPGPAAEDEPSPVADVAPAKGKGKGKGKDDAEEKKPAYRKADQSKSNALKYTIIFGLVALGIAGAAGYRAYSDKKAEREEKIKAEKEKQDKEEAERKRNEIPGYDPNAANKAQAVQPQPANQQATPKEVPIPEEGMPKEPPKVTPKKGEKGTTTPKKGEKGSNPAAAKKGGETAGKLSVGGAQNINLAPLGKNELVPEDAKAIPVAVPFAGVKQVFPPPNEQSDAAVFYQDGGKLILERFSPNGGASVGKDVEEPVDAGPAVADCVLTPKNERFALVKGGKVTVWQLGEGKKKLVDGFDPYEKEPDLKAAGVAAVYLADPPTRFATVAGDGTVHVWDTATKNRVGTFAARKKGATKVAAGRSANVEPDRRSVVVAVGGTVYRVRIDGEVGGDEVGHLNGEPAQSLALAGTDAGVVYAFEADKKDKYVAVLTGGKPVIYKWPANAGDPVYAQWAEDKAGVASSNGGVLWIELKEGRVRPVCLMLSPGDKGHHVPFNGRHWYLLPASDPKRSVLAQLSNPGGPTDFVDKPTGVPTYRVDAKGLSSGK